MPRPSLTAALIVLDAGEHLRRCLASVREHVDQIVVVDTGSTDDTLAIAKEFGATIGHFAWCDDFAAARNAALALVETDWVLSIDADEELFLKAGPIALEQAFTIAPDSVLMLVDIEDARHGGVSKAGRIFKRVPGAHWELPIHETIALPGFEHVPPVDVGQGIALRHHGYTDEGAAKSDRNLRILRAHLAKDPDNASSRFYLSRECAYAGLHDEGLEAIGDLLEDDRFEGIRRADILALAMWHAVTLRHFAEAIEWSKEARREGVSTVWTEYLRSLAFVGARNTAKALEAAEQACRLPYPEGTLLGLQDIWSAKRFELRAMLRQGPT